MRLYNRPFFIRMSGSSCGAFWGCWGGSTGGTSVCSALGSSVEADCISQLGAGIVYGRNGVCHQTANRILSAAGIIIPPNFTQVRTTYVMYGVFGRNLSSQSQADWWPQRKVACSGGSPPPRGVTQPFEPSDGSGRLSLSIGRDSMRDFAARGEPADRRSELSWVLQEGLGHSIDERTLDTLAAIQSQLQRRQAALVLSLESNSISSEEYVRQLDEAMRQATEIGEALLGYNDFHKVFGEFSVRSMIDPSSFFERPEHDRRSKLRLPDADRCISSGFVLPLKYRLLARKTAVSGIFCFGRLTSSAEM